ncbi:MAG: hypothetical protein MUO38_04085, partial [Anaerolineales bacterium]|nr:hypothetical protein [Anaerolineales bacterium]
QSATTRPGRKNGAIFPPPGYSLPRAHPAGAIRTVFRTLTLGDISPDGIDQPLARVRRGVPEQPPPRTILAPVAVLEPGHVAALSQGSQRSLRRLAVVGVDKVEEGCRQQVALAEAKRAC